ncbi:MAG: segregation/condensation protein A [Candidatus Magasanikbacteria bacterium]|jgi:segregation and condensation protein A|nr:segregation/condensation protein A [Candidatus Magasanikbacteria bacterium]MBT4220820.1 segregation/condensation protein A [Candidatus Magasanikbacteria bacterium]MBT4350165.1 segregation/condensation protein A [Candidatus Magasanikbacteria bacterium]MBT4541392.1 segregation/condensation protein A [Candidatus Magasanikbacteria bacterium]MBT6253168.1 segregation/condensation protein A [Candidatus Magasanikbacteria bacterium]
MNQTSNNSIDLQLGQFAGPLDLLLHVLQEKELHITEVSLSLVTEQYLGYLDALEDDHKHEELADFLVVATKLLLIKARALLPHFSFQEEEDMNELEEQLRRYKRFVDASKKLHQLWLHPHRSLPRIEPPRKATSFVWPTNVTLDRLHERMVQLVERLSPPKALPTATIDQRVSMKDTINRIRTLLSSESQVIFQEVVGKTQNKTALIVGFIALLELMKQKEVFLHQDHTFGDIVIESAS